MNNCIFCDNCEANRNYYQSRGCRTIDKKFIDGTELKDLIEQLDNAKTQSEKDRLSVEVIKKAREYKLNYERNFYVRR